MRSTAQQGMFKQPKSKPRNVRGAIHLPLTASCLGWRCVNGRRVAASSQVQLSC